MPRHVKQIIVPTLCCVWLASMCFSPPEAHKGITSKYNYTEHVFPILRDRCGSCHFSGGPAPMSLVDYLQAVPWAESIREQLVAQKMPPWYVDPTGPAVKGGLALPTKDLDILLNWAAGGTPRADEKTFIFGAPQGVSSPSYAGPSRHWTAGPPDQEIAMDAGYTLPAGTVEGDHTFTLSTGFSAPKWVERVDLLPGDRSMVRAASIAVEDGPLLALWVPGHQAVAAPRGTAFLVPARAMLTVQMHYKKNWQDEQETKTDRSRIGLYFTEAPLSGKSIQTLSIVASAPLANAADTMRFGQSLTGATRVVAFSPSLDRAYESIVIDAVAAGGRRQTLLKLRAAQPQWYRRYWLQEPIELPSGTKVEVTASPSPPDELAPPLPKRDPLGVGVDYVPL